jgi:uncharacterized glyoxalase superfamily protein PhnB
MSGWGVIPSTRVGDMAEAVAFYVGTLEFTVTGGGEDADNTSVVRGDARLMLEIAGDLYSDEYNSAIRQRLGSQSAMSLYIEADDVEQFHARLQEAGARIIDPLAERPWGQVEFTVEDHEGNWLTFWKKTGGGAKEGKA